MQRDYGVQVTKIADIKKDFKKTIKEHEDSSRNLEQYYSFCSVIESRERI
jgi:hypothetical protein